MSGFLSRSFQNTYRMMAGPRSHSSRASEIIESTTKCPKRPFRPTSRMEHGAPPSAPPRNGHANSSRLRAKFSNRLCGWKRRRARLIEGNCLQTYWVESFRSQSTTTRWIGRLSRGSTSRSRNSSVEFPNRNSVRFVYDRSVAMVKSAWHCFTNCKTA